jgi:predicted AAA+ superfamily ATPase
MIGLGMNRFVNSQLEQWALSDPRKALLVRGARQVGKTYSVRQLANRFRYFIEVNLEIDSAARSFFEKTIEPDELCKRLSAYYSLPVIPGETLIFLDEIQSSIPAIRSLRYFCEQKPDLHVVAAGSLLEFALEELPSFGVGRISSLYMYPMNFAEFTEAVAGKGYISQLMVKDNDLPVDQVFHDRFIELFREYCIVGGMPQVVEHYRRKKDFLECQILLDELLNSLRDDFAKYKTRISTLKLRETLQSVSYQAGAKFKYSKVSDTGAQESYKNALELLVMAGLVHKIYHTSAGGIPLGAQINPRRFKMIPMDIGLHQRMLGLDLSELVSLGAPELINRGSLAETFVGLEFISWQTTHTKAQLYYWHREARSSNAELDYVIQKSSLIVPVEVKSGRRGSMQSLALFLNKHACKFGVRLSLENIGKYNNVFVLPVYLAGRILSPDFKFTDSEYLGASIK